MRRAFDRFAARRRCTVNGRCGIGRGVGLEARGVGGFSRALTNEHAICGVATCLSNLRGKLLGVRGDVACPELHRLRVHLHVRDHGGQRIGLTAGAFRKHAQRLTLRTTSSH